MAEQRGLIKHYAQGGESAVKAYRFLCKGQDSQLELLRNSLGELFEAPAEEEASEDRIGLAPPPGHCPATRQSCPHQLHDEKRDQVVGACSLLT